MRRWPTAEIEAFYTRGDKPVGVLRVLRALEHTLLRQPGRPSPHGLRVPAGRGRTQVRYAEFFWNPTGTGASAGHRLSRRCSRRSCARDRAMRRPTSASSGRLVPAIDREAGPEASGMRDGAVGDRPPRRRGARHRHRLPRGRPAAGAVRRRLRSCAPRRPEDHRTRRRIRHALAATCARARRAAAVDRIDHGYTVVDDPSSLRVCAERGHRVHRGADQLLLPAHAAARTLGAGPPDPPHAASWACACTRTPTIRRCTT